MRHAIKGFRPGETFHTPAGVVETHPNDGGAVLTKDQIAYFEGNNYKLVKVGDVPPDEPEMPVDPAAAEIIESQRRAAAQVAALADKVPPATAEAK